jgi:hypothetical protein
VYFLDEVGVPWQRLMVTLVATSEDASCACTHTMSEVPTTNTFLGACQVAMYVEIYLE